MSKPRKEKETLQSFYSFLEQPSEKTLVLLQAYMLMQLRARPQFMRRWQKAMYWRKSVFNKTEPPCFCKRNFRVIWNELRSADMREADKFRLISDVFDIRLEPVKRMAGQ